MLITKEIEYTAGSGIKARGFLAYEESADTSRPAILVGHDWRGRSDFYCEKACEVAKLGYIGFTLDMYGDAQLGETTEAKLKLLQPLKDDRAELLARVQSGYDILLEQDGVNPDKVAAMGYCFGGMCVLDLARSGADIKGAVSFHGILEAPANVPSSKISSKVLILHGHEDSFVSPEKLLEFADEMTVKEVDWQIHIYGRTHHSFTNPHMDDPVLGLKYDKVANERSWAITKAYLEELFI